MLCAGQLLIRIWKGSAIDQREHVGGRWRGGRVLHKGTFALLLLLLSSQQYCIQTVLFFFKYGIKYTVSQKVVHFRKNG